MSVAAPARASDDPGDAEVAAAAQLYFDGRALTARDSLVRLVEQPGAQPQFARLRALQTLLDICIAAHSDACVSRYGAAYAEAARPAPDADLALKAELARNAAYYFDAGRLALGRDDVTAAILDWPPWRDESTDNAELYLQRQILGARVALAQGKPALALTFLDKALSIAATLEPGGADSYVVARELGQAIGLLAEIGQTERAYGLLRTAGGFIGDTLPPRSVDAAQFAVTAGSLLADVGDLDGAAKMLAIAAQSLTDIELDQDTRDWLLGTTLRLGAVIAAPRGDLAGARRMIDAHPLGRFYREPGRTPEDREEFAYLATRAFVAAIERTEDPAALAALTRPIGGTAGDEVEVLRAFGRLMLMPAGDARNAVLTDFGRGVRDYAVSSVSQVPGAWYRSDPIDSVLLALALSGARADGKDNGDIAFALFQLGSRFGPTFDADALTALGAARSEADRTAVHVALRLRARRDRLERAGIQRAIAHLGSPAQAESHDRAARQALLHAAGELTNAERVAAAAGAPLAGANVVPLKRFQRVLAPDEAALGVALTVGGLEYMCIRRDRATRSRGFTDLSRLLLDARLVRSGLTATHAPSEASDAQFPVEAAVRLYDDLVRPFEACLKPGDRILWLPAVSAFSLPISALLPAPPPRLARGWDLAQADWLVRRHAISYPGSPSAIIAARSGRPAGRAAGFLGVGDPVASDRDAEGLPPLPDTRAELEDSARGFGVSRLLLQKEATESQVRAALGTPYRYISFATHGLVRDDLQGLAEPALLLTPAARADPADDGLLTATEIADMALAARFVALSACNTANFDLSEMARQLPALASAFAVAGVPTTLGTLWPVNSETGRIVVADTFARLRQDPAASPADALAAAQRAFLDHPPARPYLHPRFWAPFIILGDGGEAPP